MVFVCTCACAPPRCTKLLLTLCVRARVCFRVRAFFVRGTGMDPEFWRCSIVASDRAIWCLANGYLLGEVKRRRAGAECVSVGHMLHTDLFAFQCFSGQFAAA